MTYKYVPGGNHSSEKNDLIHRIIISLWIMMNVFTDDSHFGPEILRNINSRIFSFAS